MPSMTEYIVGMMQAAGYAPSDLASVRFWNDDEKRWLMLGVHQARAAFDAVQVADVPAAVRGRLEFVIESQTDRTRFRYDVTAGQFVQVEDDDQYVLTVEDLTVP